MASDGVDFQLNGLPELLGKLDALDYDMKRKGGRFALRKAAEVIRNQVIQNALSIDDPSTSERISKNVVTRWSGRTFKKTGNLAFRVGILGGAKGAAEAVGEVTGQGKENPGGDTFYWRFVEFGTQNSPAHPFVRPAISQVGNKPVDEFISQYSKKIDRVLKAANRRASE